LNTLVQMVEGGMGVTLLPEMTLNGGILKGTHLISRPFASQVPSRTVALVSRPSSARRGISICSPTSSSSSSSARRTGSCARLARTRSKENSTQGARARRKRYP
jgi:hypothetical protein